MWNLACLWFCSSALYVLSARAYVQVVESLVGYEISNSPLNTNKLDQGKRGKAITRADRSSWVVFSRSFSWICLICLEWGIGTLFTLNKPRNSLDEWDHLIVHFSPWPLFPIFWVWSGRFFLLRVGEVQRILRGLVYSFLYRLKTVPLQLSQAIILFS